MGGQGGGKKRKANPGVGVDFKRVKHKVGKKLPKAQNDTDVSFRARSINLPGQHLGEDKGVATNSQNLTLKELLTQVAHYSDKSRKSAMSGLTDLFSQHPAEVQKNTAELVTILSERVTDIEQPVRLELLTLLRTSVLPRVDPAAFRPFLPVLMAHICGAMTHHALDIRMDALKFLDALMNHSPELVVASYLEPCLSHFCSLLSRSHRGRSIKGQSVASLLKVLTALESFLDRAFMGGSPSGTNSSSSAAGAAVVPPTKAQQRAAAAAAAAVAAQPAQQDSPDAARFDTLWHDRCNWPSSSAWGGGNAAQSLWQGGGASGADAGGASAAAVRAVQLAQAAVSSHAQMVSPTSSAKAPPKGSGGAAAASASIPLRNKWATSVGAPILGGGAAAADASLGVVSAAARLVVLLFECWSECTPSQLALSPELPAAQSLTKIMTCADVVLRRLLLQPPQGADGALQDDGNRPLLQQLQDVVLRRVLPHFPATAPAVKPPAPVGEALVQYNLAAVQLLCNFLPLAASEPGHSTRQDVVPSGTLAWQDALAQFCIGVLDAGLVLPSEGMLSEALGGVSADGQAPAVTAATYFVVLDAVAAAVPLVEPAAVAALTEAVARLAGRLTPRSSVRGACLRLQHSLMGMARRGVVRLGEQQVASWLAVLPKLLWDLGHASPAMSEVALRMLHDASRFSRPDSLLADALAALQPQLAPLFFTQLPPAQSPPAGRAGSAATPNVGSRAQLGSAATAAPEVAAPPSCPACTAESVAAAATAALRPQLLEGPFCRLPQPLVELALDAVALQSGAPLHPSLLRALLAACHSPALPEQVSVRAAQTLMSRLSAAAANSDALLTQTASALLTLFFAAGEAASGGGGTLSCRRRLVTDAACLSLRACLPATTLLRVIGKQVLEAVSVDDHTLSFPSTGATPAEPPRRHATTQRNATHSDIPSVAPQQYSSQQYGPCVPQQYSLLRLAHLAAVENSRLGTQVASADDRSNPGNASRASSASPPPPGLQALWPALPAVIVRCGVRHLRPSSRCPPSSQPATADAGVDSDEARACLSACEELLVSCPQLVGPTLFALGSVVSSSASSSQTAQQAAQDRAAEAVDAQPATSNKSTAKAKDKAAQRLDKRQQQQQQQPRHSQTCTQETHVAAVLFAQRVLQCPALRLSLVMGDRAHTQAALKAIVSPAAAAGPSEADCPSAWVPSVVGVAECRRLELMATDLWGTVPLAHSAQAS